MMHKSPHRFTLLFALSLLVPSAATLAATLATTQANTPANTLANNAQVAAQSTYHKTSKQQNRNHYTKAYSRLIKVANAMGGMDKIKSLAGQRLIATGSRFEPEQSFIPGGDSIHIADYKYSLLQSFITPQSVTQWSVSTFYPSPAQRNFTEIINGEVAAVTGLDNLLGINQAPMQAIRMAARSKQYFASTPLSFIHYALAHPQELTYLGKQKRENRLQHVFSLSVSELAWQQPAKLYVDVVSNLPSALETLEDDAVYGDTLWRVKFNNWQQIDGIWLPALVEHTINQRLIHTVSYDSIDLLYKLDDLLFAVPDELQRPLNEQLFAWGNRSSQFFGRFLLTGVPFDLDQSSPESVNLVDIAPGIVHILGFTHNTLVIEMNDYLVVIDPPLYEQRTQTVLNAINQRWADKPIKYIVPSHFHNDHIGGLRGYAAAGANLIVGYGTRQHYETLLNTAHTVYPDSLSLHPVDVSITEVPADEAYFITDGERRIRLFDIKNSHVTGMLVPYIEDAKLVFVSDLYNPDAFPVPLPPLFSFWSLDLLTGLEKSGLDIDWLAGAHGSVVSYERFVFDVETTFKN